LKWFANGVLGDEPGSFRAFGFDKLFVRPSVLLDHGLKFSGVGSVDFFHLGVIALEQRTIGRELSANLLVTRARPRFGFGRIGSLA